MLTVIIRFRRKYIEENRILVVHEQTCKIVKKKKKKILVKKDRFS